MKRIGLVLTLLAVFIGWSVPSYAQVTPHKFLMGYSSGGPVFSANFLSGQLDSRLTFSRASNATMFDATGAMVFAPANMFLNSATLGTQSVTVVVGQSYTMSAYGTGSVALSAGASGTWTGTGAGNRVSLAFTATTTTATFTVTGSVTSAQLEPTSYNSPQTYKPTTSAAYYGPRFDYNPSTLALNGLLIEESRTNVFLASTVPATQSITVTAQAYTLSFYGTGTITLTGTSTAGPLTGTGANNLVQLTFTPTAGTLTLTLSGTITNPQLEAGSFATSRIPTYGATATRANDSLVNTSIPWFNATQGTMVTEYIIAGVSSSTYPVIASFNDNSALNVIRTDVTSATNVEGIIKVSSSTTAQKILTNGSMGVVHKIGLLYSSATFNAAQDGTVSTTATPSSLPTVNRLALGRSSDAETSLYFNGWLRSFKYWNTTKTAAQLQALTQ